jgi:RNA polymerase sigma-70 factor (sigma-E family)
MGSDSLAVGVGWGERALQERDRRISVLFGQHYASLCGLASVILGDADLAEEIVMEAVAKTFTGWNRIRNQERADLYLKRAVVNLCRSRIRRSVIERRVNETVQGWENLRPAAWDENLHETAREVWNAVRDLPVRQRACVVMFYMDDLSEAQISEVLDCSTGTVRSQLSRARDKLRRSLSAEVGQGAR